MHVCICLLTPAWRARVRTNIYVYAYLCSVCVCVGGGGGVEGVVRAFVYMHVTMDVRIY